MIKYITNIIKLYFDIITNNWIEISWKSNIVLKILHPIHKFNKYNNLAKYKYWINRKIQSKLLIFLLYNTFEYEKLIYHYYLLFIHLINIIIHSLSW